MYNSLWLHGLQHARLPCPSPTPRACSKSCPSSWRCHPTISSSVIPFSCLYSFPISGSFLMCWLFASRGQSIEEYLCCHCSVTQLCPTLCDSMNCSTPGFPVLRHLPELAQTHVHWVSDAIQPSHPLSSPSLPAFNLSQHQNVFQWVSSLHQVAKVLELQLQHQSFQWIFRTDFL